MKRQTIIRHKLKYAMSCVLLLLVFLSLGMKGNAAGSASVSLVMDQSFFYNDGTTTLPSNVEIEYVLESLNATNPMPANSTGGKYVFKAKGNEQITIGPITFTLSGLYSYRLSPSLSNGFGFVSQNKYYTIDIYVDDQMNYMVIITNDQGKKTNHIDFVYLDPAATLPVPTPTPAPPITPKPNPSISPTPGGTPSPTPVPGGISTKPPGPGNDSGLGGTISTPKTGDDSNILLWILLFICSLIGLLVCAIIKKHIQPESKAKIRLESEQS